jgi:DmsE family decaheme c-type cytochrome
MRMFEKIVKTRAALLAISLVMAFSPALQAADKADKAKKEKGSSWVRMALDEQAAAVAAVDQAKYSKDGADTCVSCHDEENEYPIFPIFNTKHAVKADLRGPFAHDNKQCESCHGAGANHTKAKKADKRAGNIINFGKKAWTPVKDQNEKCMTCHQTHQRIGWKGSTHEFNDVACASCHKVHVAKDSILDKREQSKVCFDCHANKQAKFFQASHHPVKEGQMACTDCHDVHGEKGSGLMVKANTRQMCVKCHAEKRGPFLWEHAPVAEDCGHCHDPHGSNHAALLKKRAPQLCQQCHAPGDHPSLSMNDNRRLSGNMFLVGKSCSNCHSAVHGSNHPSGMTKLR